MPANDLYNLADREAMEAAGKGDWANAIQWGKKVPMSWDVWQKFPTAGGDNKTEMPDEAIKQIHAHLAKYPNEQSGFHHELAANLPQNIQPETLNMLARHGADDYMISDAVHAHPNFKPDVQMKHEEGAANFWNDYERKVKPEHFATIKSMQTNRPESVSFHRDQSHAYPDQKVPEEGSSDANMALLPHLRNHAAMAQEAVKKDGYMRENHIKYMKGPTGEYEPHVKVYRGVAGEYAKAIRKAAGHDPKTNTVLNKKLKIPSASFSSWTTDHNTATMFAAPHGVPGNEHGMVMETHLPLRDLLHSGTHHVTPLQVHAHPNEQEFVFQHPSGHYKVKAKDIHFAVPDQKGGNFAGYSYKQPKVRKKVQPVGEPKSAAQPVAKFELDGNEVTIADLTGLVWGKPMQKMINAGDIQHLTRQHEPKGPSTVDSAKHQEMHPAALNHAVESYRKHAVHSDSDMRSSLHAPEGMTAKAMFSTPKDENGRTHSFMLKPYHERVVHPGTNLAKWNQHAVAGGWAEMANQGLYHAGGLGDQHMKVHTDTYDHGKEGNKHQAIVIHMAKGYKPVHESDDISPKDKKDAKKMQMMDFLANNVDRHSWNLLHSPERGLLAIDNGRNFQYKTSSRNTPEPDHDDRVANYNATGNPFSGFKAVDHDQAMSKPKEHEADWSEAFDWWKNKSPAIRKEFQRHLELVKDPKVKEHLSRNFDLRTTHLDRLAESRSPGWQSRKVAIHPYGG